MPLLARHFLALHCRQIDRRLEGFSPEALAMLRRHRYPGNVRELSNIIERALALATGPRIEANNLPDLSGRPVAEPPAAPPPSPAPLRDALSATEQERLVDALHQTNWNISRAAARLGISRNTLRYRIRNTASIPEWRRRGRRPPSPSTTTTSPKSFGP